jgi:hypothetical protein
MMITKGKPKKLGEKPVQCHFMHPEPHIKPIGTEHGLSG